MQGRTNNAKVPPMPNIASVLKIEITRLARKEARAATQTLKSTVLANRAEIAALKRRADNLERELKQVRKSTTQVPRRPVANETQDKQFRFSAKRLASHRRRLGLSANDLGLLLSTSGQSIYNWEAGTTRPRANHFAGIAAIRRMTKKDAAALLASLRDR
jgi:DNA-binding transcriptional regulator YiaG